MKHTQEEISKIWDDVKNGKYTGSSDSYRPVICSDDDVEQSISIPDPQGSSREIYSRRNENEEWKVVPFVGE